MPKRVSKRIMPVLTGIHDGDRRWDMPISVALAALLLFMPAAFGAVEAWSELVVLIAVTVMLIGLAFRSAIDGSFRRSSSFAHWLLIMCVGAIAFQIIPLPTWLVAVISPSTAATWDEVLLSTQASHAQSALSDTMGSGRGLTVSLYPYATAHMLRLVLIGVAIFTIVASTFRRPDAIEWLLAVVFLIGCAEAALAMAQIATLSSQIYWAIGPPVGNVVTAGTFVHHSHFSQFMNLSLGAGVGLLLMQIRKASRDRHSNKRRSQKATTVKRIQGGSRVGYFTKRKNRRAASLNWDKHGWLICGLILCAVSVMTSMSRNGAISMCIAATVTGTALYCRGTLGTRGWILVTVPFGVLAGLILFGFDDVYARLASLDEGEDLSERWELTAGTLRAWMAYPIWGIGLGTHEFVFPAFDTSSVINIANSADNEYAQLLEEMGIVGAVLVASFVAVIVAICVRLMMTGKTPVSTAAFGLAYGLIAVAFHSLSDFGQRIPAVFCLTAVSCGLLVAMARYEQALLAKSGKTLQPHGFVNWIVYRRGGSVALLIGLSLVSVWAIRDAYFAFEGERWRALTLGIEDHLREQDWQGVDQDFVDLIAAAEVAYDRDRRNAEYGYWLNLYRWRAISRFENPQTGQVVLHPEAVPAARKIADELTKVRMICPTYGPPYALEGQIRLFVLDDERGYDLIQKGYRLAPNDPPTCLVTGELAARTQQAEIARAALNRAVALEPAYFSDAANAYVAYLGRPELAQALAGDDHRRLRQLGEMLVKYGRFDDLGTQLCRQADELLRNVVSGDDASPDEFATAAQLEVREGSHDSAIHLYRRALAINYGNIEWRLALARLLADAGKPEAAVHEAKICLRLRPNNSAARRLIEQLSTSTNL